MNLSPQKIFSSTDEIDIPENRLTPILRALFIVFILSFSFDYKAPNIDFGSAKQGGSVFQYAFLGICLASGGLIILIGFRHLLVRPGIYMVLLWCFYIIFMVFVAFASGNEFGRIARLLIAPLLVTVALTVTHIIASSGMRPAEAVFWFLICCIINILWKFGFGILGSGLSITEVRMGILSPAMRFVFAWVACALILRPKFTPWVLVVLIFPMIPTVYSITRSVFLPMMMSGMCAAFSLVLGILWKMYSPKQPFQKAGTIALAGFLGIFSVIIMAMIQPKVIDRWSHRMFDNQGGGATTEDLSSLMRKAEAKSMVDILSQDPLTYIYGKGLGASYYWDESYFPELFLVYPDDRHQFGSLEIYTAGHSVWTYTLFSSGIIGTIITLGTFIYCSFLSIYAGFKNSQTIMGRRAPDTYLIFLPFAAVMATLSESITRNPFDERLTGILFGFMLALPQFYFNRAYYLNYRENIAAGTDQLVLDEDEYNNYMNSPQQPANTY